MAGRWSFSTLSLLPGSMGRLHVAPTVILAVGSALVGTDPTRDPPNRRAARTLEQFVNYKAVYGLVRGKGESVATLDRFDLWRAGEACEGVTDPRVLPLHVFDQAGCPDLATPDERKRFRHSFGPAGDREDPSSRRWRQQAMHGRDELQVAGCALPPGAHWDVSSDRKTFRLINLKGVWEVKRRAYLNVYPDEYVRGPGRSFQKQVRRLWPRDAKNAPPREGH